MELNLAYFWIFINLWNWIEFCGINVKRISLSNSFTPTLCYGSLAGEECVVYRVILVLVCRTDIVLSYIIKKISAYYEIFAKLVWLKYATMVICVVLKQSDSGTSLLIYMLV